MLLIIFGTRNRQQTLDEGQFFCPRCQAPRRYQHKKAKRYFSLYFIPLIPMGDGGEFIECETCGAAFEPNVLTHEPSAPPPNPAQMMNNIGPALQRGAAVEHIIRDLTNIGLDREVAARTVQSYLNDNNANGTRYCNTCGLTYAGNITSCGSCGTRL